MRFEITYPHIDDCLSGKKKLPPLPEMSHEEEIQLRELLMLDILDPKSEEINPGVGADEMNALWDNKAKTR